MKVTEKKAGEGRVKLDAVASPAEVNHAFHVAEQAFAQKAALRPSGTKSIAQLAEEQLGLKDLDAVIRADALEFLAPFAIDKRNLMPAYPAKPSSDQVLTRNQPFEFTQTVVLKPEYELSSYEPVSLTIPPLVIEPQEVEAQINAMLENYADFEEAQPRAIEPGDAFDVALTVSQGGTPIDALATDNRLYIMGMGLMPPAFDENVLGMNVGETKTFTFDMPSPEGPETFECTVTVNQLKQKKVPELTDEWVKAHYPMYENAQALRQAVEEAVTSQRTSQYESLKLQLAASELAKRFQGKIDDAVYESMRDTLMENIQLNLAQQGVPIQEYIQSQGGEQQFTMMLLMQTRQMLVQDYALDALFRHEKLELTEEDELAAAASMNPQDPAGTKRSMAEMGRAFALREMAMRMKANRWLLDHAVITEQPLQTSDNPEVSA